MTYEYLKQHWQEECLKDGILTIPKGVHEIDRSCRLSRCKDLRTIIVEDDGLSIKRDSLNGCSALKEIRGLSDDYTIHGGGLFFKKRLWSLLCYKELHYPEGAEWLDDTAATRLDVLHLPASIKYIEKQQYQEWDDREPVYMRAQKIIVPVGYKDYFIKLFMEDWGEPTLGCMIYGEYIARDFVEAFNEKVVEE